MIKKKIQTKNAPEAIGPYVQGISLGKNIVITSGQIPIDPISKNIPKGIEKQTEIVLLNIKEIIQKSGLLVNNIVKTTIFTTNLNKINIINNIYENFFIKNKVIIFPVRSCVEVSRLPKNVLIEIEAMAFKE